MTKTELRDIAHDLAQTFKNKGFVVHFYESKSSDSYYIKLDYGLSHTIRISDHHGKKHLLYRYNVLRNLRKRETKRVSRGLIREYYPVHEIDSMIKKIQEEKMVKLIQFGPNQYRVLLEREREKSKRNKSAFWRQATKL